MDSFSVENLSMYLDRASFWSTYLSTEEINDKALLPWRCIPWNTQTCLAVVQYVIKFCADLENCELTQMVMGLNDCAKSYDEAYRRFCDDKKLLLHFPGFEMHQEHVDGLNRIQQELSALFVNVFVPHVKRFFKVPKTHQLVENDKHLKLNEILAGFMDFLLQILNCEGNSNSSSRETQLYTVLQKELTILVTFLGDAPFQPTCELEEKVNQLLAEFEMLANEVGSFIYSFVFSVRPVRPSKFYAGLSALLEMVEILNVKIKQHCINFSQLPMSLTSRSDVLGSFFIIGSLVEDLESMINRQINFPPAIKSQIKELHDELELSNNSIKVIQGQQAMYTDKQKEPLVQIRDLAYQAEYLINHHYVGNIPLWYLSLRFPSIIEKIKVARRGYEHIDEMNAGEVKKGHVGKVIYQTTVPPAYMDSTPPVELNDNLTKSILDDLIGKEGKRRQTVSIYGIPGIGKTTLATKLYNCRSAREYFKRRVWCVVSRTYSLRRLLIEILFSMECNLKESDILHEGDNDLGLCIQNHLCQSRYLIVLDDVWHSDVYYNLQTYFPDVGNGSRIMLTSRIKDAAPNGSILHTPPFLSNDQAWDLLVEKVFPRNSCPPQVLTIGKGIAAKCSGIPLAIVTVAGILANLEMEESAWGRVGNQLDAIWIDGQSYCEKVLELSYERLPHNIKPCYLYFAAFPEHAEISVKKLALWWISEGFIPKSDDKSHEEIAEMYLSDLISRSLVLTAQRRSGGGIKTCKIHTLLHDMCTRKANEVNFLKTTKDGYSIYDKHERLSFLSESYTFSRVFGLHRRSFVGYYANRLPYLRTMALLKIVDLLPSTCDSSEIPVRLDLTFQVRYLSINEMPKRMLTNLFNLEFLYVRSKEKVGLPSQVQRMVKLRHLVVKPKAEFKKKWNASQTTNLTCLSHVCIDKQKDVEILRCYPHLQYLKCQWSFETRQPDLSFLSELKSLKIVFGEYLSREMMSHFILPSTIQKLTLRGMRLPCMEISMIRGLPNLHVLKMENLVTGDDDVWVTRDGEFQNLKHLEVNECYNLSLWVSCRNHFPKLECLVLSQWHNLIEIPSDLGYITTLQRIEVRDCKKEAYLSAIAIEQEQYAHGNEKLWVDIIDKSWTKEQLVLESALMDSHALENLLDCLEEVLNVHTDETGETAISTTDNDEPVLFWSREAYLVVISYALQPCFNSYTHILNPIIKDLCCLARSYMGIKTLLPQYHDPDGILKKQKQQDLLAVLFNFLAPEVRTLFVVPQLENGCYQDPKENEMLAAFMDFLLRLLICESNNNSTHKQQYALLQNELSFLIAILGDIPFQTTHLELEDQVNNLLAEFGGYANEAGGFFFSCIFPIQPVEVNWFYEGTDALVEWAWFLHAKIEEYCQNFSQIPVSLISRPVVIDSFFIVDSLIQELQGTVMNGRLSSFPPDDAIANQIQAFCGELEQARTFMKVLQVPRTTTTHEQKEALIEIRDLAYEAEYLINSHFVGSIPVWYLSLRLPSISEKTRLVNERLQQIRASEVRKVSGGEVSLTYTGNTTTMDNIHFMKFNEDVTNQIYSDLFSIRKASREIIVLFGIPGIGKTTTATNLCNSKQASEHFDKKAWCVISQRNCLRTLLITILTDLLADKQDVDLITKTDAELGEFIHKALWGRRYLIVLDDLWETDVWDKLRRYFPGEKNGSRVLITTRNKDTVPDANSVHELQILQLDHCWDLLENIVFPNDPCPPYLVDVGKRIASKCSGVPLAVVTVAGILVNFEKEESEWERVEQQLNTLLLDDDLSGYRKIMELSYEHLPCSKKPCFLYFARFPEDAEISTKKLIRYWISEGFIQDDGNMSLEDTADKYLLDLIHRSLVMVAKRRVDGRIKTCRIHDLLHDICIRKANEENFCNSTNLFHLYDKHQHLRLSSSSWRPLDLHCRSIRGLHKQHSSSNFQTMPLLKVVEFSPKEYLFIDFPIFDLPVQLRYLVIDDLDQTTVANLVSLEVIHVRNTVCFEIPSVILTTKLRHLILEGGGQFEDDCSSTSRATNLRSLSGLRIYRKKDVQILRFLTGLQKLKCQWQIETERPDLRILDKLESLRITFWISPGSQISSEINFPSTIKKLCLSRSRLPWEKMSIIGQLPNLEVLKLQNGAFVGEEWETKDEEFKELLLLKIESHGLKQWTSESGHFPVLKCLVLVKCRGLQEIPNDFGYINTLEKIELTDCTKEACSSAIQIKEEQRDSGNECLQVDIIDNFSSWMAHMG